MRSRTITRIISRNTNQENKPIASPATAATLCYRGKTGQKQCEFPPKALPSVHMGSKVGGKIYQVIHQEDVWPEMVELRNRREGRGCEKTERDEEDYINQDGRRLKRREACLVSLGEEKSWCDAE